MMVLVKQGAEGRECLGEVRKSLANAGGLERIPLRFANET